MTLVARKMYSQEFKDTLVQEVIRSSRPIAQVARENGVVEQTLGNWVKAHRRSNPAPVVELSGSERDRLRDLERQVRELRVENEFLGKATAFFARKSQ